MTRKRDNKGRFIRANDGLASFTRETANAAIGWRGYRDGPFVGQVPTSACGTTSWLVKAAIERIPEDCFKKGYVWVAEADQINAIEALEKRLNIKKKKKLALQYARAEGEAYIYFDVQPGDISKPLELDRVRAGGLRFANVLRKRDLSKGPRVTDPLSAFYGQPEYYLINTTRVHPSRVIRFVRNENPDTGDGVSDLTHLMQPIVAAETARDNVVALTTESLIDIMKVEGLMEAVQDPDTEALLRERYSLFREMKATNRMGVLDMEKEDYDRKPATFATLPEVIESMRREAAAAIDIPYSLLFGREGGLGTNGETEISEYYDSIATIQVNDIQPVCEPLDECVIRSALGSRPPEIYLQWLSLWEMSDKEKADVARQIADTAKTLADGGIIPAEVLTKSTVNALTENGSFPGLEQDYAEWELAGGWENETPDEAEGVPDDDNPAE